MAVECRRETDIGGVDLGLFDCGYQSCIPGYVTDSNGKRSILLCILNVTDDL